MTDDFSHWFAGFFAGEGFFYIRKYMRPNIVVSCNAGITLRADDEPILTEIRDYLGIGTVYARVYPKHNLNPQTTWRIENKAGCLKLVEFFDAYPLRAKKSKDFGIWRNAVKAWEAGDRDSVVASREQLMASRTYRDED